MGIFNRGVNKAAVSPAPEPTVKAAAAVGSGSFSGYGTYGGYTSQQQGINFVGAYYTYYEGEARNRAMSVPTISRARDLLASVIGSTQLCMYMERWNETEGEMEQVDLAPRSWLRQPDPSVPYSTLMSWTLDDLFFFGRAFWYITSRTADGFPATFTRLPAGTVTTQDQSGPVWFAPSSEVYFQGGMIPPEDLVQFISPVQGIIYMSEQAVATALRLEESRYRNAQSAMPSGVLKQTGGEPLSAQELADLAAAFNNARMSNQTAALNEFLDYTETKALPDNMLMVESAEFQAKELCRLANIPFYLAGVNIGSYQYTTSRGAREDLYLFGARQYLDCVSQTLSMNNVLPRGTYVKFDIDDYLKGVMEDAMEDMPETTQTPDTEPLEN
jgi:phage portal protein BeeE